MWLVGCYIYMGRLLVLHQNLNLKKKGINKKMVVGLFLKCNEKFLMGHRINDDGLYC